jgi:uncharacterized phiE125 gp8 family phage protein
MIYPTLPDFQATTQIITPPSGLVISVDEAKLFARVTNTVENALFEQFIRAATETFERLTNLALLQRTVLFRFNRVPQGGRVPLPYAPAIAVTSFEARTGTTWTSVAPDQYELIIQTRGRSYLVVDYGATLDLAWHNTLPLRVVYTAGYASAAAVPDAVKTAISYLAYAYYTRGSSTDGTIPAHVQTVIDTMKVRG